MVDDLYRASWDDAFAQFVQSIEEYVSLELPADATPEEHKLQDCIRQHLEEYKAATKKEEEENKHGSTTSKKTSRS